MNHKTPTHPTPDHLELSLHTPETQLYSRLLAGDSV